MTAENVQKRTLGVSSPPAALAAPNWFLALSGVAVASGWTAWWRRRATTRTPGSACVSDERSPARLVLLLYATAIVAAGAGWRHIDPLPLKLLGER
ncbi:hypothetical protein ACNHKD_16525 [Methylocystis sp. JAN1]|uniref:hypothetical protein n=1 Tax=Methylocystis sp. JAN1 TaxID=3397211 RepID=UPI003FA31C3C